MSSSSKTIVVPHPLSPMMSTYEIEATNLGPAYRHDIDFSALIAALPGFNVNGMTVASYETNRMNTVFGPWTAARPIIVQITTGIFRALVMPPDGEAVAVEEGDDKSGLRPTRGVLVRAGSQLALQSLVRTRSAFLTFISGPLVATDDPFASWYAGLNTNDRPSFIELDR